MVEQTDFTTWTENDIDRFRDWLGQMFPEKSSDTLDNLRWLAGKAFQVIPSAELNGIVTDLPLFEARLQNSDFEASYWPGYLRHKVRRPLRLLAMYVRGETDPETVEAFARHAHALDLPRERQTEATPLPLYQGSKTAAERRKQNRRVHAMRSPKKGAGVTLATAAAEQDEDPKNTEGYYQSILDHQVVQVRQLDSMGMSEGEIRKNLRFLIAIGISHLTPETKWLAVQDLPGGIERSIEIAKGRGKQTVSIRSVLDTTLLDALESDVRYCLEHDAGDGDSTGTSTETDGAGEDDNEREMLTG